MIGFLRGRLIHVSEDGVVVDVAGVGYEVLMDRLSLSSIAADGSEVELYVRTVVREDAITLYGFLDATSRRVFDHLVTVNGIGPRLASQILGGMPLQELVRAVREKDVRTLVALPGVGRKLAERLALELSEKFWTIEAAGAPAPSSRNADAMDDVRSALLNLGFTAREVEAAVRSLQPEAGEGLEDLIRRAIAAMKTRT